MIEARAISKRREMLLRNFDTIGLPPSKGYNLFNIVQFRGDTRWNANSKICQEPKAQGNRQQPGFLVFQNQYLR